MLMKDITKSQFVTRNMSSDTSIKVAFVCLGNICRSPMAEAVFRKIVNENKLADTVTYIDSFGTAGYHVGDRSDSRTIKTCKNHDVPINHRGQQIKSKHFTEFDYILCMDDSNLYNLKRLKPKNSTAVVGMFGEWKDSDSFDTVIDDPYYGGTDGFETCYQQCVSFSKAFLKKELGVNIP